ncbi:SO2930 family diheme c-type cytochrome [Arvimicrobium flavum]|uniref:SO2930 family diheme c-type cytochrome n=1 Tax=Arvimicrobium flavum TaxID=3393320 RepID=UPI00237A4906|nr:SO2930 family diheme c-type cytochrome [Mesorhizobium shangrilense]
MRWLAEGFAAGAAAALLCIAAAMSADAAPADDLILAKSPPKSLSEFGFFGDLRGQAPAAGVVPFDLNTPLFSDGAMKTRFVYVPAGKQAIYDEVEAFAFPVGSALIKTFAFPADYRQPDQNLRLVETRVLLRQQTGWQAWAYLWNDAQTDAVLKIAGAKVDIATTTADGTPLQFSYSVPNKNQCKGCHALGGEIVPLGPKARNLNRNHSYAGVEENQLGHWAAAGVLVGAPEPAAAPAVPDWRDAAASLDLRARAWLDVNCAHCHRREGPASNSGLFLTWGEQDPVAYGIRKRPVAAGKGSGGRDFDIAPGEPERSILLYRVESTEAGVMMPELGRHLADPDAVALLSAWISSLK